MSFNQFSRRGFIALTGGLSALWAPLAQAQKQLPVIAILDSGTADASSSKMQMSLLDIGMRELGLVEGRDYLIETRWAGSDAGRFPVLATELLALRPAAIVVSTNLAAHAVQKLSTTVPIVGTGLNAPVATGLVTSLARPGGNITGVSTMAEDVLLKLFEIMRETLPTARRVMVVTNPTNPSHRGMLDLVASHATKDSIAIHTVNVSTPADLEAAFTQLSQQPPDALVVLTDNSLFALSDRLIARALAQRVPTFGNYSDPFARAGALFAYARDPKEAFQGVSRLLKKIMDGVAPRELPFEQPTRFNLFINLRTAKALGIEIPPTLLFTADEVIE